MTLAWLVAGPALIVVLNSDKTGLMVVVWALGLAMLASAFAERHPAGTVGYGRYARLRWTAVVFAGLAWMWVEALKVDGGELGAFFFTVLVFVPVWLIGLIRVGLISSNQKGARSKASTRRGKPPVTDAE